MLQSVIMECITRSFNIIILDLKENTRSNWTLKMAGVMPG